MASLYVLFVVVHWSMTLIQKEYPKNPSVRAYLLDYFENLMLDDASEDHNEVIIPLPILTKVKIQTAKLMREYVDNFVHVYRRTNNCELSDDEIRTHLAYRGMSNVVSWIKPEEHFKVDKLSWMGVTFVEPTNVVKYGSVVT